MKKGMDLTISIICNCAFFVILRKDENEIIAIRDWLIYLLKKMGYNDKEIESNLFYFDSNIENTWKLFN